eukprot:jgi/Bigna1/126622/aug1.3_g1330
MLSQEGTPPPSPPNEELSQQQELFQQAIYHTRETKNETLEIKITQAYKEWQALLQEKDQGERELDVMDKKIQKMKMEVGRLGLSRRYGVACRRVTDRTSAYDFVSAAKLLGPLKMVLKTHLREGGEEGNVVETANVVLQPRQIKKMKSKLNSLQRSIIEGLESLAKDVQFLSQNDDDDVTFANAHPPRLKDFLSNFGTTVERSSAKAFYTIRIKSTKCEEDGHSDDDNVTTAEDVISAALDLGQESTVYRCIRHFAERIDREGFAISGRIENMLVSKVLIPSMPIHVRDLHGFQSTASLCLREYRARWEMAGLAVPGGMTLKEANRKRVSKSIDQWLSGIEIGGREERRYDSTDIVNFATKEGLMDEIPEEIYRRYVEAKHKIGSEKAHTAKASSSSAAAAAAINHFGSGSGLGTNITTTTESPPLPDTIKEFPGQIPRLFMNRCQVTLLGAARAIIARCGYEEVTIVNNNNYNKPCYINTTINSGSSSGGGGDEDSTSIILGKFEQESWGILSAHGDKGSSSISSSSRRRSADGGNRTTMTTKNKKNQTKTTTTTTTTRRRISRTRPLQISEDMLRLVQLLYGICSLAEEAKKSISSSSSIMESKDDEEERNQEEQKVESASIMKIAVQVVQLYIALTLPTFNNQLATSNFCASRRAAIIRNDTIFLAGHLASLHKFFASAEVRRKMRRKQWNMKSSEKLTIRSGRALRLIDLIPPVKALGTRVFSLQLDRLHALATAVLLPIVSTHHNNTLTNLQIAARYRECRESVAEALEIPQRLATAWGPPPPRISNNNTSKGGGCGCVMPSKASCFIIGKFLEMTMESLVNGTLMAKDISQECAARIRTLMIQTIETIRKINFLYSEDNKGEGNYHRKIREGEDNLQQEGVYQYLDSYGKAMALFRILDEDQTLNSVRRAYNQGYLLALNPGEIKNVIKAIWTKSPKREALLATISQLPSNIPSSFSSSISVEI